MSGFLGSIANSNKVQVFDVVPRRVQRNLVEEHSERSSTILDAIGNREAVAVTDASMSGNALATHWTQSAKSNDEEHNGGVHDNEWKEAMTPEGEALGALDLIMHAKNNTQSLSQGGVVIFNDDKKNNKRNRSKKTKESQCTLEAESIVEWIRREINDAKTSIEVKYANDKPLVHLNFKQQPAAELIKRCDEHSKVKCADILQTPVQSTMQHLGILTPIQNKRVLDKNINVLIQEIDTIKHEKNIVEEKFGEFAEWIDLEAKNSFPGGAGIGTIKSAAGCNHHSTRNSVVNDGLVCNRYPQCNEIEDWQYVALCTSINYLKDACLIDLETSLFNIKNSNSERETFELILNDIRQCLR